MYNHRGAPTGTNHTPTPRDIQHAKYNAMRTAHGLKTHKFAPEGYGDYSNPETADAQRQTDRAFDRGDY